MTVDARPLTTLMVALSMVGLVVLLPLSAFGVEPDESMPPLPERNPARVPGAEVVAKPPLPGDVPTVPWTEAEVAAAKAKCTELLAATPLDYQPLDPIKEGLCGAPAPILVKSIGKDPAVAIDPPATLTCPLAHALGVWLHDIVQPDAKALLGAPVTRLHNATSYACRNRYGAAQGPLSEHALANALDVSEFVLASGDAITVLDNWPHALIVPPLPSPKPTRAALTSPAAPSTPKQTAPRIVEVTKVKADPPPSPPPVATPPAEDSVAEKRSEFVKEVHDDACKDFGTVLGPEANAAHKNHFHLDMKERRKSYCE
jgi:hypothetical protein